MIPKLLPSWYSNYALAIGVTSYRVVDGRLQQTWSSWTWALLINILNLLLLPPMFWLTAEYVRKSKLFPDLVPHSLQIWFSVSYVTIVFTMLSRGKLDSAIVDVERVTMRLKHQIIDNVGSCLRYMFYLKWVTVLGMCLCGLVACWMVPQERRWVVLLIIFTTNNAMNIPCIAAHRYYMSLWHISCAYRYINHQMDKFVESVRSREPSRRELREFHRLWSLHAMLGRCTMRLNKVHGPQILATRLDVLAFCAIFGYCGLIFMVSSRSLPLYSCLFGNTIYYTRMIDCFLLDKMCDLTIQHQNAPYHAVTEGIYSKEVQYSLYHSIMI